MVEANTAIFSALDQFCLQAGDSIRNSGKTRWISSDATTRMILKDARLTSLISFASSLKIARFDHGSTAFFFTLGLDLAPTPPHDFLIEVNLDGSLLTLALAELQPRPVGSALEIRNVVEVDDRENNSEYKGHDPAYIASLFPDIRCFNAINVSPDETHRIFFLLCLADLSRANTWMGTDLKETFASLSELNPTSIPYQTLCRSVFDTDPSSVFLALYRCLEALYAYSHVIALNKELGIAKPWDEVAEILEKKLGWRPREESSLGTLLREDTLEGDLKEVLSAMNVALQPSADVFNVATKQIYQLRNSVVHYRPFQQHFNPHEVDWNRLCMAMCSLVLDVY